MSKKYRKSPIIEAVCEFRFQPGMAWEKSFPEQIHEILQGTFPKKRPVTSFQSSFTVAPQGSQQFLQQSDVLQVLREDEKALLLIDVDRIAVSHLAPYPTWEDFLPLIKQGFDAYKRVAQPSGLHRTGLRYINQIEIPGNQISLSEYLNVFPALNWQLTQGHGPFGLMFQIPFINGRDILNLQLTSGIANSPNSLAVILDLDYFFGLSGAVSFEQVFDWLEEAHTNVEKAFEGVIRDSLRDIFEEIQ